MTKGTFKREKTKLILLGLQHTFTMFASFLGGLPKYLYWKKEVLALGPKSLSSHGA